MQYFHGWKDKQTTILINLYAVMIMRKLRNIKSILERIYKVESKDELP
jgi:hypothetical protein